MKKTIFFALLALGAYWGSLHKTAVNDFFGKVANAAKTSFSSPDQKPTGEPEVSTAPAPAVVTPQSEEPAAVATAPAPAAKLPELPENVYYTLDRITFTTPTGVKAIPAATQVHKVGDQDGMFVVDDGKIRIPARQYKLTRDPAEVAALMQRAAADLPPPASNGLAAAHAAPAATPATSSSTDYKAKARVIQVQIEAINRQISQKQSELTEARNKDAYERSRGHASFYGTAIARAQSDITALEGHKTRLALEMAALPR